MCPNYNALDWEHPLEFHPYFDWPELKIFHRGLRLRVLFLTVAEQRGYGTCPAHRCLLSSPGNCSRLRYVRKYRIYVAALQTRYFRDAQVFLISKPGHFDRIALGNNYTRTCADRWGGAVVSEHRMGGGAVAVLLFLPGAAVAKQHFGLQPYLVLVRFFKKYKYGIFC